jgi:hypothetical protein
MARIDPIHLTVDIDALGRPRIAVRKSITRPGHNECASLLRDAFAGVFGIQRGNWPEWADHEIYRLAGKMSAAALRDHPLRRSTVPCLCVEFKPAQGSGYDDGFTGEEHCSECGGVSRALLCDGTCRK